MIKKTAHFIALLAAIAGSGPAFATNCTASDGYPQLSDSDIAALLVGATACYPASAPFTNQEYLSGAMSGTITDYKKGPADPIDPSANIGTYGIAGGVSGQITYSYTGGPSYTYSVFGPTSGIYDFCPSGSPPPIQIRVASGSSGC